MEAARISVDHSFGPAGVLTPQKPAPLSAVPTTHTTPAKPTARKERSEILAVLARAAEDPAYIARLTYDPSGALAEYQLGQAARAALACGDLQWLEGRVGKLDDRLRTWVDCRLQQEIW